MRRRTHPAIMAVAASTGPVRPPDMSRQVGGAVFVALLVALAGGSTLPQTIAPVQRGWTPMAVAALAGAAIVAAMRLPKAATQASRETTR